MQYKTIRVVSPEQLDPATAQTPGSLSLAAIHAGAGIESPIWGGLFRVEPGARTETHHDGSKTRSSISSAALHTFGGESGGSLTRQHTPGTFCISRRCFHTRRLILPAKYLFSGWLFEALLSPSL